MRLPSGICTGSLFHGNLDRAKFWRDQVFICSVLPLTTEWWSSTPEGQSQSRLTRKLDLGFQFFYSYYLTCFPSLFQIATCCRRKPQILVWNFSVSSSYMNSSPWASPLVRTNWSYLLIFVLTDGAKGTQLFLKNTARLWLSNHDKQFQNRKEMFIVMQLMNRITFLRRIWTWNFSWVLGIASQNTNISLVKQMIPMDISFQLRIIIFTMRHATKAQRRVKKKWCFSE